MSRKLIAMLLTFSLINIKLTSTFENHYENKKALMQNSETLMQIALHQHFLTLIQLSGAICQAEGINSDKELKELSLNFQKIVEKEKKGIPLTPKEILATHRTIFLNKLARLNKKELEKETYKKQSKEKITTIDELSEFSRG